MPEDLSPADTLSAIEGLVMAFDYGAARTGIAVGETLTGSARPLQTLSCQQNQPDWQTLDRLIKEWRPRALVVGLPMAMDGSRTPTTRAARRFARSLEERYTLPLFLHDERLSSREAEGRYLQARQQGHARRRQAQQLDAMAASVILESWMANRHTR